MPEAPPDLGHEAPSPPGGGAESGLWRAIVEAAPEAIIVSRPDGEITYFNPAAERLFGYRAAEVVGRNIVALVPPSPRRRADPVRWLARWAAEPDPEQSRRLEFEARRADGSEMPVDVRVSEARVSGERRFVITVRDNTARRQENAGLREANLVALRILLVAEDAIVSCDADQRITFFNLGAERLFGWPMAEAVGQPLDILLPQASRAVHAGLVRTFAAGEVPSRMMSERRSVTGRRRNGELFPAEATITKVTVNGVLTLTACVRDASGKPFRQRMPSGA